MRGEAAAPEWNEQLSFVELFPPLTRSLRLQLRDDAPLVDVALATHVLDLRQISHPGRAGKCIWQMRAASSRPPSASKLQPDNPGPLRKSGPSHITTLLQADPCPQSLSCRPQTTLGLASLTKS